MSVAAWSSPCRAVSISSVVAALMTAMGHDVVGITLQLYDHGAASARKGACCAGQDIHDARRVADALSIPHYVLDYEERFARDVMANFADSYAAGETPIPCVACNREIKFGALLETARELGADVLATGHYVSRREDADGPALYRARDADRDQSYFLFATTPAQLVRLWFPLGDYRKSEVRALARALGVPVADKADSQDICFVPTGSYAEVVARMRPDAVAEGEIVHVDGTVLGRHNGVIHFTVGQRRGLGVTSTEPLFVVRIDARARRVVVGPRHALQTTGLVLRDVNWLGRSGPAAAGPLEIAVRVRSTRPPQPASLWLGADGSARVLLHGAEQGLAAGQACVFYADDGSQARVLGGGFIDRTLRRDEWMGDAGMTGAGAREREAATASTAV